MRTHVAPPESEEELVLRARALAGRTIEEVARDVRTAVPPDTKRAKGFVGQLAEAALGATAGSKDAPDFEALGVELKTLPVGADGRPRETTFVCSIPLVRLTEIDWEESLLWRKLRRVLWIPVEADPAVLLPRRRFGTGLLWSPTPDEVAVLRADWEHIATLVAEGQTERITGRLGRWLHVRPKAAHSRVRRTALDDAGAIALTGPRGFYLRTSFTIRVLERALGG